MTRLCGLVLVFVSFSLSGCGGDGKVAGAKLKVSVHSTKLKETDAISVTFNPDGGGELASANGTMKSQPFECLRAGNAPGALPGKYKLSVNVTPYAGMDPPARQQEIANFSKQFTPANTKLSYEVTSDKEQSIDIDLDAQTV